MRRPVAAALAGLLCAALLSLSAAAVHAQPKTNNATPGGANATNNATASTNNATGGTNNATAGTNNATAGTNNANVHVVDEALRQKAREATALLQKNQYDEAEKLFVEIHAKDPAYEEAMFNYALLLERTKRPDEGLAILEKLIELRPDSAQPSFYLVGFLQRRKEDVKAREVMEEAGRRFPLDPQVHNRLATLYANDPERAIAEYKKALELDPNEKTALNNLGVIYINQNRYKDAATILERYTTLSPRAANGRFNLASASLALGDKTKAIALYEELTTRRPGDAFAQSGLIVAYTLAGRYADADPLIAKATPEGGALPAPSIAYAAGLRWLFAGDLDKAEPLLAHATKEAPGQIYQILARGELLRQRGRLEDAEKLLQTSAKASVSNASLAQPYLALIALDRKQEEPARQLVQASIKLQPDYVDPNSFVHLVRLPPTSAARLQTLMTVQPPTPAPVAKRGCGCAIPGRSAPPATLGLAVLGLAAFGLALRRR